nr:Ldh family oxidoreductase [Mesorhizobium sp. WSM4875]
MSITTQEAWELVLDIFKSNGIPLDKAAAMTEVVVRAEADQAFSHGLHRVAGCVGAVRSGKVNASASPSIILEKGGGLKSRREKLLASSRSRRANLMTDPSGHEGR